MNITVEIQTRGQARRDYLQWIDAKAKSKNEKEKSLKRKTRIALN